MIRRLHLGDAIIISGSFDDPLCCAFLPLDDLRGEIRIFERVGRQEKNFNVLLFARSP